MESKQRKLQGKVISNKMNQTAVVLIERTVVHFTGKYIKRHSKLSIHDANNELNIGDFVEIAETKPISKTKSWTLVSVLKKHDGGLV